MKANVFISLLLLSLVSCRAWQIDHNAFLVKDATAENQFGHLVNSYYARLDILTNLIELLNDAQGERQLLEAVAKAYWEARQVDLTEFKVKDRQWMARVELTQGKLSEALARFTPQLMNYDNPNNKEDVGLMKERIETAEQRIREELDRYNETVSDHNIAFSLWPTNLLVIRSGYTPYIPIKGYYE